MDWTDAVLGLAMIWGACKIGAMVLEIRRDGPPRSRSYRELVAESRKAKTNWPWQ